MRAGKRGWVLFALVWAISGPLQAQVTTGNILGTVKDSTGAVVPGATVELTNTNTGIGRTVATDSQGFYRAPNLPLGQYAVTVRVSGFRTEVRQGITLNVGQNAVIDFTLEVGSVAERIEITGEAPLIETTTATVAGVVSEKRVQDLPLNARDLIELAPLQAGVVYAVGAPAGDVRGGYGTKLSIAGTRYDSNLVQLDGIAVSGATGSSGSAAGVMMGAETVREFSVVVSAYSAEYGNHTGGVFNAVTKTGTNSLHGSLFEFLRNDKFDARNFFDGEEKPPYKRNQFGGSFGGPIFKDRSFFFGSYEGLRERLGETNTFNVPSLDMRQGILPGLTQGQCSNASGTLQANGSCLIPVAATARPWLLNYQLPNGRDFRNGVAEFIDARVLPTREDFFTVRLDHKISDRDSLFGRYTFSDAERVPDEGLLVGQLVTTRSHYITVGETRIFSPAVINQFVAGLSRTGAFTINYILPGHTLPLQTFTNATGEGFVGSLTVSGLSPFGADDSSPRTGLLNLYQVKDDVFYTRGSHSFKFGFMAWRYQDAEGVSGTRGGVYGFGSLAEFLRGTPNLFQANTEQLKSTTSYPRQSLFGLYAQDDFRLTPRLTVNLGLRYEFVTQFYEKYGRVANPRDPITPGLTPQGIIHGNPAFLNPSLKNWAPRVGFAWDPTGSGKTSIRGGAGVFHYQVFAMGNLQNSLAKGVPGEAAGELDSRVAIDFPNAFFTQQNLLAAGVRLEGLQYKMDQPVIYKYSLDIDRAVFPNTSVNLGYSGTRGVHLLRVVSTNVPIAQNFNGRLLIPTNAPFVHPLFPRVRPRISDAESDYHAFRLTVNRRFSKGLQLTGAYTLSKATDDASNWAGNSDWSNSPGNPPYSTIKDKGLAAFDIRRNLVVNFTYDLPGRNVPGVVGKVLGGWQTSGILSARDGIPFTVSVQTPSHFTNVTGRPDVDTSTKVQYDTRNPDGYIVRSGTSIPGFMPPPTNIVGNAGRGILIGPGAVKFDWVLVKQTYVTERVSLQFRSEFFNLFNRANFTTPSGTRLFVRSGAIDPTVGQIRNTITTARQVQFAMRLVF